MINMQNMNKVVCGTSKGSLYKQIKPVLVGEHDLPLTFFVCKTAHFTLSWFVGLAFNVYSIEPRHEITCFMHRRKTPKP